MTEKLSCAFVCQEKCTTITGAPESELRTQLSTSFLRRCFASVCEEALCWSSSSVPPGARLPVGSETESAVNSGTVCMGGEEMCVQCTCQIMHMSCDSR